MSEYEQSKAGIEEWDRWPQTLAELGDAAPGFVFLGMKSPKRRQFEKLCRELEEAATEYYGRKPIGK